MNDSQYLMELIQERDKMVFLNQVNLDSDTRAATKAAMESGCRPDTFNLAQGKIEHLMETDKHKRYTIIFN